MRSCGACGGPGPCLWTDRGQRYVCRACHETPGDPFFTMRGVVRYVLVDLRSVVGNCLLFWAEGRSGYTCDLDGAHVFDERGAFRQHECRPDIDWPIPVDVARSLVVRHVRREAVLAWARENQDPRRTDPYGAQPREEAEADDD